MTIVLLHTSNASRRPHLARARQYARRHHEQLVVVVKNPSWEYEYCDRLIAADTTDLAATVAAVAQLAGELDQPITAVTTFVEHSVPAAAAVAAHLHLPFISTETAVLARDKHAMRRAFDDGGLNQPGYALARSLAEARAVAGQLGFPLVMKPIIGGGSMFVRRVDGDDELADNFETVQRGSWAGFDYDPLYESSLTRHRGAVLLEQYLPGDEISVESVVVNGHTAVVAIHDKPLPMEGPFFEEVLYTTPTELDSGTVAAIGDQTQRAHHALGIERGVTHTEFRIAPDGRPMILETAARLGGGPVYQSVRISTGVDLVDAALDIAADREPDLTRSANRYVGFYLFFATRPGVLVGYKGVDEALADQRVADLNLYARPGDLVDVPPRVWQAHGHAIFTSGSADELRGTYRWLAETIQVETTPTAANRDTSAA